MTKINVEGILEKHTGLKGLTSLSDALKSAIKEIVEAVIDKCSEEAEVDFRDAPCVDMRYKIDKKSILNVKKMISYE